MKKFVYISSIASPHQVKYCYELQRYFDTEFWFYDRTGHRADFWRMDLGEKCRLIPRVLFKKNARYFTVSHLSMLNVFNPDIIMLGGMSIPANFLAYCWGILHHKRVIIFTERSRSKKGILRRKSFISFLFRKLYAKIDLLLVSESDTVPQFRDEFGWGDKVVAHRYSSDIDSYFLHPYRMVKENYTFIFPNRLIEIYNPILALEIFKKICDKYPNSILRINECGELRMKCEEYIVKHSLEKNVFFISDLKKWDDLGKLYEQCDIMFLPAKFSNGNFTIVEAMASGMGIVISNKILGVGSLIENGVNGFRCDPTVDNFISCFEKYINDPHLFVEHTKINREKVKPLGATSTAKEFYDILIAENFLIE